MAKVWCCRRFQDAEIFKITPTKKNISEEYVLYNRSCSYCNRPIVEILRIDDSYRILDPVRLKSKNVIAFVDNMDVIFKKHYKSSHKNKISKFVLNYNEFGKIKKCFSNLSSLNIGKIETDPLSCLKTFKPSQVSL